MKHLDSDLNERLANAIDALSDGDMESAVDTIESMATNQPMIYVYDGKRALSMTGPGTSQAATKLLGILMSTAERN